MLFFLRFPSATSFQETEPMIELDEYSIPRNDYFQLTFRHLLKRIIWVLAYGAVVFAVMSIFYGCWFPLYAGFPVTLIVVTIICYIQSWNYVPSAKEPHHYQKRKLTFDAGKFHVQLEDGSESHVLLSHVVMADRMGDYYRLFLSKIVFYPVHVSAFRSEEDRTRFEKEILGDKLKTQTFPWKATLIFLLISACLLGSASMLRHPHSAPPESEVFYDEE